MSYDNREWFVPGVSLYKKINSEEDKPVILQYVEKYLLVELKKKLYYYYGMKYLSPRNVKITYFFNATLKSLGTTILSVNSD